MKTDVTLSNRDILPKTKDEKLASNRDVIEQHLIAGGEGVELTDIQERLLERWTYADEVIRANVGRMKREQIANLIIKKFGVHRATAYQDIVNAEYVFSSSSPLNKKYRIQLRIEFLENQIRLAAAGNDHFSVAQLEKVLQKYYDSYPETNAKQSPRSFHFHVNSKQVADSVIPVEEAEATIDAVIKNIGALQVIDLEEQTDDDGE